MSEIEDPSSLSFEQSTRQLQPSSKHQCNPIFVFMILGFVFLIVGIVQLVTNYQETAYSFQLWSDGTKLTNKPNFVSFTEDRQAAVYIYLPWLTQIKETNRFEGEKIEDFNPSADSCHHFRYNREINKSLSIGGTVLNPNQYAFPCGRFPSLFYGEDISVKVNGTSSAIYSDDLTIFDYSVRNFNRDSQWVDLTERKFQAWMQQNAVIGTTKFIGVMKGGFQGYFSIELQLQKIWEQNSGSVWIYLTNNAAFGGYNVAFCWINLLESAIAFLFAFSVFLFQKITSGQVKDQSVNKLKQIEELTSEQTYSGKSYNL